MSAANALREQIASLVRQYYQEQFSNRPFSPGRDLAHYAGRVFDAEELCNLVDSSLDFFLTANRYAERFEADFAEYLGLSDALLVNSGSSANLVALTTLTSPTLGERRLKPGDEVLTVAAGFPTTLAPILQNNLVPVFVDVNLGDYTADPGPPRGRRRAEDARDHDGAHARCPVRPRRRRASSRSSTISGSSRTTATPLARATADASPARSATWRRCPSTRPTTSRWVKGAASSRTTSAWRASRGRIATGAATAIARGARATRAGRGSASSSARCRTASTTSTCTATSATT